MSWRVLLPIVIGTLLVAGCAGSAAPTAPEAPFVVAVLPPEEPMDPRTAIPGQRCIFLVRANGGDASQPIEIEVDAGTASVGVAPDVIDDETVAEVTVVPPPTADEANLAVTITVRRGSSAVTATRTIPVWPQTDTLEAEARGRLATFTTWLAAERPDLGITPATPWDGSALQTKMLVVSHYQFLSDDWEAALEWHVMIPPHDWGRLILRRRWVEDRPSIAFEIASVSGGDAPREIEPPEVVLR
jgi:hypothetical protein